jgi:hypothetical protein
LYSARAESQEFKQFNSHLTPFPQGPTESHGVGYCWTMESPWNILVFWFLIFVRLGLNSGLCTYKADALPLQSRLQSVLLWLFWRWGLELFAQVGLKLRPSQSQPPK